LEKAALNGKLNGTVETNGVEAKAVAHGQLNGAVEANGVEAKTEGQPLVVQEVRREP
jgi:hypothetical protein